MSLSIALLLVANIAGAAAFAPLSFHRPNTALHMSSEAPSVPVTITGNNIELTPALEDYVNKRLERPLGKLAKSGAILDCEVNLIVNKNPKVKKGHRVELTTELKGTTINVKDETEDMYSTIDAVASRLGRKLVKYKERRLDGWHGGNHMEEDFAKALDAIEEEVEIVEQEEFIDPEAPLVTKIKSFDLKNPIPLQEAIFALDYIDHDFYVFRNEETDEVNVVYKRNVGGVGLIQPS